MDSASRFGGQKPVHRSASETKNREFSEFLAVPVGLRGSFLHPSQAKAHLHSHGLAFGMQAPAMSG